VKLTQGTGRGTCLWIIIFIEMSNLLYKLYRKIENILSVFVSFIPFDIDFNFFNFFYNFVWEDIIVVVFLYNFIKYIILCSINELI
jgi:hypothetical protein